MYAQQEEEGASCLCVSESLSGHSSPWLKNIIQYVSVSRMRFSTERAGELLTGGCREGVNACVQCTCSCACTYPGGVIRERVRIVEGNQ